MNTLQRWHIDWYENGEQVSGTYVTKDLWNEAEPELLMHLLITHTLEQSR